MKEAAQLKPLPETERWVMRQIRQDGTTQDFLICTKKLYPSAIRQQVAYPKAIARLNKCLNLVMVSHEFDENLIMHDNPSIIYRYDALSLANEIQLIGKALEAVANNPDSEFEFRTNGESQQLWEAQQKDLGFPELGKYKGFGMGLSPNHYIYQ